MEEKVSIVPKDVTNPFQLLAAWLVALVLLDGSFLGAATIIKNPSWCTGLLVIAAVANVIAFVIVAFVLQTKFRIEMLDDTHYFKSLETNRILNVIKENKAYLERLREGTSKSDSETLDIIGNLQTQVSSIVQKLSTTPKRSSGKTNKADSLNDIYMQIENTRSEIEDQKRLIKWNRYSIELNDLLPHFNQIVSAFAENGISVTSYFGSTSERSEKPQQFILSFGGGIPIDILRMLIQLLSGYELMGISYASDSIHRYKLYIGSYIYKVKKYLPLNEAEKYLMGSNTDINMLISAIDKYNGK